MNSASKIRREVWEKEGKLLCTGCKKKLDLKKFNDHPGKFLGKQTFCRTCNTNNCREYHRSDLAYFRNTISGHKTKGYPVCQKWIDNTELAAKAMLKEIGPRPSPKHSVDRICTYAPLEPGNIRWATAKIQTNNRRAKSLNGFHAGIHIINYNMKRAARRTNVGR